MSQIDIKRDIEIVSTGGFFCEACLMGKPLDDISPDPRYCQICYEVLQNEKGPVEPKDYWTPEGFFVHYGKKYGVNKNCDTVCLGSVDENQVSAPAQNANAKPPVEEEVVTKLPIKANIPAVDDSNHGVMLQKHAGGRPRKTGKVTRMTEWRRQQKELQGVLM